MEIVFLPHALERMDRRGISEQEVRNVLERPDLEYPGRLGRMVAECSPSDVGRALAVRVVYNRGLEQERIVVTVELGRPTTNPPEGGDA